MKMTGFRKGWYFLYIAIVAGFVLLINYHSGKRFRRIDLTENKIYTIAPATKDLLRSLSDYVTIELYFSDNLPPQLQKVKEDVGDIVTEFKVYGGKNLVVEWKNPRPNSLAKQSALSLGLEQVRLPIVEKDRQTIVKTISGVAVRYAGRAEVIPLVAGTRNFEYELIKRISMVLRMERPRVAILRTDNSTEMDYTRQQYKELFTVLEKEYTVENIDVSKSYYIDPAIKTLIVPGGNESFYENPFAVAAIDQFFMKGGKLIVLTNRIGVNLAASPFGKKQESSLFDLLTHYGVDVVPELLADISCDVIQLTQEVEGEQKSYPMEYPFFMKLTEEGIVSDNPGLAGFSGLVFPWASPLRVSDSLSETVVVDTLLMSSPVSFTMGDPYKLNPRVYWNKRLAKARENGEVRSRPFAYHLHGDFSSLYASDTTSNEIIRETKGNDLVVIGNSNFLTGGKVNMLFMKNLTDWITTNDQLVSIRNRVLADRSFKKGSLSDEKVRATKYRIINIALVPTLLILAGLLLFLSRKKAQKNAGKIVPKGNE